MASAALTASIAKAALMMLLMEHPDGYYGCKRDMADKRIDYSALLRVTFATPPSKCSKGGSKHVSVCKAPAGQVREESDISCQDLIDGMDLLPPHFRRQVETYSPKTGK